MVGSDTVSELGPKQSDAAIGAINNAAVRIREVKAFFVPVDFRTWLLVKVETDEPGLFGWGEATVEWKARSVAAALSELSELCVGESPLAPRALVRKMRKRHYWQPGVIGMSAISGIEMACWDIIGKTIGRPVADLFGGRIRNRVPVYTHLGYGSSQEVYDRSMTEAISAKIDEIATAGYKGVKIVNVP